MTIVVQVKQCNSFHFYLYRSIIFHVIWQNKISVNPPAKCDAMSGKMACNGGSNMKDVVYKLDGFPLCKMSCGSFWVQAS